MCLEDVAPLQVQDMQCSFGVFLRKPGATLVENHVQMSKSLTKTDIKIISLSLALFRFQKTKVGFFRSAPPGSVQKSWLSAIAKNPFVVFTTS